MNLILTHRCNKNCSFCFAKNVYPKDDMSTYFVENLIDHFPEVNHYKLLGGEPTLNLDFKEIVRLIYKKNKSLSLITNLLFSEEICNFISEYDFPLLISLSELNEKNISFFKRNLDSLYKKNSNRIFNWSFTISDKYTLDYYGKYCDFLLENQLDGQYQKNIRIGLDLSGKHIIHNKKLGDIIKVLIEKMAIGDPFIFFDCMIPPCVFNFNFKDFFDRYQVFELTARCVSFPFDVFSDGSAIYCYPTKHITSINNIMDYENIGDIKKLFGRQFNDYRSNIELDVRCLQCPAFREGFCGALCLGCH